MIKDHAVIPDKNMKDVPEGYKVLSEGKANILYIEQHIEKDASGLIKKPEGGRKK